MRIQSVFEELAVLQQEGLIDSYAIGGAVGATFYLEPFSTVDVDVFLDMQVQPGRILADPTPLLRRLAERGHRCEGEHVLIGGWPVQFLGPGNPLVHEALEQAAEFDVEGVLVRVFRAEHLAAIALQTGRAKDKARLLQFLEQGAVGMQIFEGILDRHHLRPQWAQFKQVFFGEEA